MTGSNILVYDMTGYPLEDSDIDVLVHAAVLYVRGGSAGKVRFTHPLAEGTLEAIGKGSMGPTNGTVFVAQYDTTSGVGRAVEYLLPYSLEDLPVPDKIVTFRRFQIAKTAKANAVEEAMREKVGKRLN